MDSSILRAIRAKLQKVYDDDSGSRFLSFPQESPFVFTPGNIPVFTGKGEFDHAALAEMATFSRAVNMPVEGPVFPAAPSGPLLWDTYQEILDTAEVAQNFPAAAWKKLKNRFHAEIDMMTDLEGNRFSPAFLSPQDAFTQEWNELALSDVESPEPDDTFEYRTVHIERPWIDFDVFASRQWRFPPRSRQEVHFPAYVSDLILVRDKTAPASATVLAYLCKRLPACPNPAPSAQWPSPGNKKVSTVRCHCGHTYYFRDPGSMVCASCGRPLGKLQATPERVWIPSSKIPFIISLPEASAIIRQYFKKQKFVDPGFVHELEKASLTLRPVYIPVWEWTMQAYGVFQVTLQKTQHPDKKDENELEVKSFQEEILTEPVSMPRTTVSILASTLVGEELHTPVKRITNRFDFLEDPLGTSYERYSKDREASQQEARTRILEQLQKKASDKYTSLLKEVKPVSMNYVSETEKLVANPVWIGQIEYKSNRYEFHVDGFSGEAAARNGYPRSKRRILRNLFLGVAVLSLLAFFGILIAAYLRGKNGV